VRVFKKNEFDLLGTALLRAAPHVVGQRMRASRALRRR
jgi:hypothetical protein